MIYYCRIFSTEFLRLIIRLVCFRLNTYLNNVKRRIISVSHLGLDVLSCDIIIWVKRTYNNDQFINGYYHDCDFAWRAFQSSRTQTLNACIFDD